jgi:hypothetical protein
MLAEPLKLSLKGSASAILREARFVALQEFASTRGWHYS